MTAMPTFPSGREPSPAEMQALLPVIARKTADESVASSTTYQNDDALFVAIPDAAGFYRVEAVVLFKSAASGATPGFKTTFTLPTGASFADCAYHLSGSAGISNSGTVTGIGITGTSTDNYVGFRGLLIMDGTHTGTLQFQWAQQTSSGTATTVSSGSWLYVERMGDV